MSRHRDYGASAFGEGDLEVDPLALFERWLGEAEAAGAPEPNAMVLSTVDPDGVPSARTVLFRGLVGGAFTFYTNYDSRKGRALGVHPVAAAVFPWWAIDRQVIVTGSVAKLSGSASDAYFASRPRGSQLAAIASEQSRPIGSRGELEVRVAALEARYPDGTAPPRPENWGGYALTPSRVEFWKGRPSRLHDRFAYTVVDVADSPGSAWQVTRLQP